MTEKEELPEVEVVYIGKFTTEGGKNAPGICPVELITPTMTADQIVGLAAFFSAVKKSLIVGCKYKVRAKLDEDGRARSIMTGDLSWHKSAGRFDHPAIAEFELREQAEAIRAKDATAERKLKANKAVNSEIRNLAIFWKAAQPNDREYVERAIIRAIRSLAIGR